MSDLINTYTEKFKIRGYEVDLTGRATSLTISNYLQEIAGNHAGNLGVSVDKLFSKKLTWVLSRLHFKMISYPFWREEISITTWPSDAYGKYATRDFELFNSKDKLIGQATTSWMLIDLTKMKPISMPEFITSIDRPQRNRAISDKFDRIPKLETIEFQKKYNVRLSDLDINQHVNNVNYIEWAIETIPIEVSKKYQLSQFEISFRAESKYGDAVISTSQEIERNGPKVYLHNLVKDNLNKELAVARSRWTER
jgi:medium-chain acyl-[acyl-carrier-protein] hydrolase